MKYYKSMFCKMLDFKGQSSLKEFWTCVLINFLFGLVSYIVALPMVVDFNAYYKVAVAVSSLYDVVVFLPMLSLTVRRLHDVKKSGWWILWGMLPIIGTIVLFYTLCQPSSFRVNPWVADYQNNKDDLYNKTYHTQGDNMQDVETDNFTGNSTISDGVPTNQPEKVANNDLQNNSDNKDASVKDGAENSILIKKLEVNATAKNTDNLEKPQTSRAEQIKQLQQAKDAGQITEEEYKSKMLEILRK